METESGAKIAIRGKGSVKEGKGRSDAAHTSNQEEDLHCLIMADTEDKVNKAKELIHNVIETAASIPEGQNELKRNQLRELAALNGTLRDDENQACQNCKYSSIFGNIQAKRSRWSNRSSQIRLPRATQLYCQHHLPCLR
jgi:splicing factor 1